MQIKRFHCTAIVCLVLSLCLTGCGSFDKRTPVVKAYDKAKAAYNQREYNTAVAGLTSFLENYPRSSLASLSRFYLAETYRQMKLYENAIAQYDDFIVKNTYTPLVPTAIYWKAFSLQQLDRYDEASSAYNSIILHFEDIAPDWAYCAEQRLIQLAPSLVE